MAIYPESKFTQLLGAHWWRRQLQGQCDVVAVSPGLIPETGLGRRVNLSMAMPDAKTVPEGECWLSPSSCLTRRDCASLLLLVLTCMMRRCAEHPASIYPR